MADADIPFLSTLRKTGDPNFGGVGYLKFFCMIDINKMAANFQFFIMANTDVPLTLEKPET